MPAVNSFISHFSKIWEQSAVDFPLFQTDYSVEEQAVREARFGEIQKKIKKLQSGINRQELKKTDPGQTFFPLFRQFLLSVFDFDQEHLEIILSDRFKNVSKEFFYQARKFGPELSPENIYQGLRNVWIMNGLQLMMDLPVEITPSVFAYSMIYPYSDNLLDDPALSNEEKHKFSDRFNKRLHGEPTEPAGFIEAQLFRLVAMIEAQFPRNEYPEVFNSLYDIHEGQTKSLKLINCNGLEEAVVRNISFEKGGSSVLADGYLVAGRLSVEQEQALFGYGIYLQLLDDIQDIKEDTKSDTRTLFAGNGNFCKKEELINMTVHFGRKVLEEMRCFRGKTNDSMLRLMNRSIESMLIESIGSNPDGYSVAWLQKIEQHSPLRFEFIRNTKAQSKSQRFDLFRKYFEQVS